MSDKTELNKRLSEDNFEYDEGSDVLEIEIIACMNITGREYYNSIRDTILNNQAIVERLEQVIDDYEKQVWESPTNHRMVVKHLKEILGDTFHSKGLRGTKN